MKIKVVSPPFLLLLFVKVGLADDPTLQPGFEFELEDEDLGMRYDSYEEGGSGIYDRSGYHGLDDDKKLFEEPEIRTQEQDSNEEGFSKDARRMELKDAWEGSLANLHPTGLRHGQISGTWARLFWEAPPLPDHIIVHNYTILCFLPEFERKLPDVSTDGNKTTFVLQGLELGTMYECDVQVSPKIGFTFDSISSFERGRQ